jgi:hypothetical protein
MNHLVTWLSKPYLCTPASSCIGLLPTDELALAMARCRRYLSGQVAGMKKQ